jgi:hypothetical protein
MHGPTRIFWANLISFSPTGNIKYAHSPHVAVLRPQDGSLGPG